LMPLADQQMCEIGAGCSGSQNEDAHWGKTVSYPLILWTKGWDTFSCGFLYSFLLENRSAMTENGTCEIAGASN
jgi:hypothetical protein